MKVPSLWSFSITVVPSVARSVEHGCRRCCEASKRVWTRGVDAVAGGGREGVEVDVAGREDVGADHDRLLPASGVAVADVPLGSTSPA